MGRKVLQNVFQILNPLKDVVLALDAEGVCIRVGVRDSFPQLSLCQSQTSSLKFSILGLK